MRHGFWRWLTACLTLVAAVGIAPNAMAFADSVRLGDLEVSVFAPDWIWQRREVNVLYAVRNLGQSRAETQVTLRLPANADGHFAYGGETSQRMGVAAGTLARGAFPGIMSLDGVPCQTYDFALEVAYGGKVDTIPFSLKTIRGAVVGTSTTAIALPVVIAFAFTLVFAVALNKMAVRGAWRVPGKPVHAAEDRPGWIDGSPQ